MSPCVRFCLLYEYSDRFIVDRHAAGRGRGDRAELEQRHQLGMVVRVAMERVNTLAGAIVKFEFPAVYDINSQ